MKDMITWKEIKAKYPQIAQRFMKEFEELFRGLGRMNKPYLTVEDIENIIAELGEGYEKGTYEVSLETWEGAQRIRNEAKQLVNDINISGEIENILKQDPKLYELFVKISETSIGSGHPGVKGKTVGWLRVDIIPAKDGREVLFIDEVQSDIVQTAQGLLEGRERYAEIKNKLIESGKYTEEELNELCKKLLDMFGNWMFEGVSTLLRWAQRVGIKWVGIHTKESKTQGTYISWIYDNIKREFGFKDEVVDLEGVGTVKIGIRRASVRKDVMKKEGYVDLALRLCDLAESLINSDISD